LNEVQNLGTGNEKPWLPTTTTQFLIHLLFQIKSANFRLWRKIQKTVGSRFLCVTSQIIFRNKTWAVRDPFLLYMEV